MIVALAAVAASLLVLGWSVLRLSSAIERQADAVEAHGNHLSLFARAYGSGADRRRKERVVRGALAIVLPFAIAAGVPALGFAAGCGAAADAEKAVKSAAEFAELAEPVLVAAYRAEQEQCLKAPATANDCVVEVRERWKPVVRHGPQGLVRARRRGRERSMSALTEGGKWLLALAQAAPAVRDVVREFWGGRVLELGPVPPDLRADFGAVDADIDRRLRDIEDPDTEEP